MGAHIPSGRKWGYPQPGIDGQVCRRESRLPDRSGIMNLLRFFTRITQPTGAVHMSTLTENITTAEASLAALSDRIVALESAVSAANARVAAAAAAIVAAAQ
jgi:hypothetical protein